MIKKFRHIVVVSMLIAACTEKINVNLDSTYTRLVVDGNIASDTATYQIRLTKTADYFFNEPVPPVTRASVFLSDGENIFPLAETKPGISGIYSTDSTFVGKKDKTYTLHIDLSEPISGESAFDAICKLNHVTHLDSIGTVFEPDWGKEGIWKIKLWAQEPGNEVNYYLFNLYRNGKLLTDTITKKVVSDDKFYNGSYMNGVDVIYLNNAHKWETINPGDTIILQMSGITEEYYNFIMQVQQSGLNIPFFSGPPANVKGNIDHGGIGFFAAYSNSFAKTIVHR
ncbi:MAG: DUF4249 domain-containing protein [Bacteroidales bacterium]|jgi:hypothetical protein|nr:DUF4249 domain-containing protein [Bacteroidales bacterium]